MKMARTTTRLQIVQQSSEMPARSFVSSHNKSAVTLWVAPSSSFTARQSLEFQSSDPLVGCRFSFGECARFPITGLRHCWSRQNKLVRNKTKAPVLAAYHGARPSGR